RRTSRPRCPSPSDTGSCYHSTRRSWPPRSTTRASSRRGRSATRRTSSSRISWPTPWSRWTGSRRSPWCPTSPARSPSSATAIATQIRSADPDLVMLNGLGVDANGLMEAMLALDGYLPPMMFALFPAPGPLLALAAENDYGILSVTMFEPNDTVLEGLSAEAAEIAQEFAARAADAGVPYTTFETQAAASWNAWEILIQGVEGAGSLDHQAICDYLQENGADLTFVGHVEFDPEKNNFWETNQMLKQVQDGDWVVVWPEDKAAAPLRGPSN